MTNIKRGLICTFVALLSGLFAAFIAGQTSLAVRANQCKTQPWGLDAVCKAGAAPVAFSAAAAGLWTGTILGAFIAGLATQKNNR